MTRAHSTNWLFDKIRKCRTLKYMFQVRAVRSIDQSVGRSVDGDLYVYVARLSNVTNLITNRSIGSEAVTCYLSITREMQKRLPPDIYLFDGNNFNQ